MTREEKNRQAYMDVLEENGTTMPNDKEYMDFYRMWFPLGSEYSRNQWYENDFDY